MTYALPEPEFVFPATPMGYTAEQMRQAFEAGRTEGLKEHVRVSIPTPSMEQAFANYYRKGFTEGRRAGKEEAAQICLGIAHKPSNVVLGVAVKCADVIRNSAQ